MPRFTYWTIILQGGPTSFRARDRETLLPTLKQLQSRDPDARLMWFANGRLWASPEQAREHARLARLTYRRTRGPDWRPGGDHRDPRARVAKPKGGGRRSSHGRNQEPRTPPGDRTGADGRAAGPKQPHRRPPKPAAGGWPKPPVPNGRQRRPYRPTGGTRRRGGKGRP